MGRRTFDRSTPDTGDLIDMKTRKPIKKTSIPVICERIRFYRCRIGMEQKALAEQLGISGNAVYNWESGRARPDVNLLPAICKSLHISLYELFDLEDPTIQYSAREQLLIEKFQTLTDGHKHAVEVMAETLGNVELAERCPTIRQLIFFEKSLAAGTADPTEFEDEGEPIFLYASRDVDRADCVFTVNGDSMEPEFHNGDMVLVQRTPTGPDLEYGEVGAFIIGNETYIKIYEEDGLHSYNRAYKPIHFCSEDKVYLIGRVISRLDEDQVATKDDVERYTALHPEEFDN